MGKIIKQAFFLKRLEKTVEDPTLNIKLFKNNNKKTVGTVHRLIPRGRLLIGAALSSVKGGTHNIKTIKSSETFGWKLSHLPKDES